MNTEVHEPDKYLRLGVRVWPLMVRELWAARELAWRLFRRNLSAKYRQSVLGYAWVLFVPAVAIGSFVLLGKAGIVVLGATAAPYPVFALAGLAVFQMFSSGLTAGCGALTESGDMIARVRFPREVLVLVAAGGAVFEFLVRAALLLAVCVLCGYRPSAVGAALFLPAAVPMLLLTLGCGFVLSLANAVVRDTAMVVSLLTTFLLFLTPVMYPAPPAARFLAEINPLSALVAGPRDLFMTGSLQDPAGFMVSSALACLVFLAGWRVFFLVETKIPERI